MLQFRIKSVLRIFKSRWFERFARKEGIRDADMLDAIDRAERGLIDADLGSGVIKQRVARIGQGKSKGFRTVILYRRGSMAFFVYGFAKSEKANLAEDEMKQFKEAAKSVLVLSEENMAQLLSRGDFVEVKLR